ncbi:MAG TPA: tRNA preQ1(34) S-adenosylmethionine ribosyltransferase-isomerase QueA [Steroidobacteraceae bacterium]|nr:tRNA preQ1(34) S-adenosylmethionine ribosyltransferase-isomerase QueA [Steroidobacteraceae bacterium]
MRRQDFAYHLPADLIAQEPPAERSAGRMLVLDRTSGAVLDRTIRDLPGELRAGDLLVVNDTRVVAARLIGHKPSGGRVEILLERALAGTQALAQLSSSKPIRAGLEVATPGGVARVLAREAQLWRIELPGPALEFFERFGEVPLPPYIHRTPGPADRERYQSIFARKPGAVAAPTASLHFDEALSRSLDARGVRRACVTLHVGAGTFLPLRGDDVAAHVLHPERASVGAAACEAIAATHTAGGRVVAVGTTVVRALESAALAAGDASVPAPREEWQAPALAPWQGETRLFIIPGFHFQVCDALLTNFHLPESTLLMLVCAFGGRRAVLEAYAHAVREQYRFFSYGDAMLITREASA